MFRADLHCHSTCSDGSHTPIELLHLAKQLGLSALSITDHDSVSAYDEPLFQEAKKLDITVGTGVEFSCEVDEISVHVLGYDFSLSHQEIWEFCQKHKERRKIRYQAILQKLREKKVFLEEDVPGLPDSVGRPHIAEQMVKKGYVKSIQEAFHHYLGEGKSCYVKGCAFSIEETIVLIRKCGGKAFLAHPHLFPTTKISKKILEMPFDGIECYYSRCSVNKELVWLSVAKKKNWLISGGSDFHGIFKPNILLGCSWVDQAHFQKIFNAAR